MQSGTRGNYDSHFNIAPNGVRQMNIPRIVVAIGARAPRANLWSAAQDHCGAHACMQLCIAQSRSNVHVVARGSWQPSCGVLHTIRWRLRARESESRPVPQPLHHRQLPVVLVVLSALLQQLRSRRLSRKLT